MKSYRIPPRYPDSSSPPTAKREFLQNQLTRLRWVQTFENELFFTKPTHQMPHTLPDLPYANDALEPTIDALTMEIHHDRHHAAYVTNLNAALEGTGLEDKPIIELLSNLNEVPEAKRGAVRNNGGGHYNHTLFWNIMGPNAGGTPTGDLAAAIDAKFGSFDAFKDAFETAGKTRFGSGWAWLLVGNDGEIAVASSPNQDSPIIEGTGVPILGLDVWEHAYYLKYQNKRPAYASAFWDAVNWDAVSANYAAAKG